MSRPNQQGTDPADRLITARTGVVEDATGAALASPGPPDAGSRTPRKSGSRPIARTRHAERNRTGRPLGLAGNGIAVETPLFRYVGRRRSDWPVRGRARIKSNRKTTMARLEGRKIIITGGASGIGRATAQLFRRGGAGGGPPSPAGNAARGPAGVTGGA